MGHYRSEMVDVEEENRIKEKQMKEKTERLEKLIKEKGLARALVDIFDHNRIYI